MRKYDILFLPGVVPFSQIPPLKFLIRAVVEMFFVVGIALFAVITTDLFLRGILYERSAFASYRSVWRRYAIVKVFLQFRIRGKSVASFLERRMR